MQESAFIVAYCYILLQKQYEIFSDFCLNQHFVYKFWHPLCHPQTIHLPFMFNYMQLMI